jgi:hypothetical protein
MEGDDPLKVVRAGIHPKAILDHFTSEERLIVQRLSSDWYVTNSGGEIRLSATSIYRYFLAKPTLNLQEAFNLEREVLFVFSDYSNFEPRTMDAFDAARNATPQSYRLETVCQVLISKDAEVERKLVRIIEADPEVPIIIPFTYNELIGNKELLLIANRFRKHFFSRDLFSFQSPLRKDLYFFGRDALVQGLASRFRSHENSGLFGLRKSGKTSIIYGVERALKRNDEAICMIDCESPSIHGLRWYELLHRLVAEAKRVKASKVETQPASEYTEKSASDAFDLDMKKVYASKRPQPLLFVLDEIERIAPGTGSSGHWKNGTDFIFFWQTLRAFFQLNREICSFLIVGTNPSVLEKSEINGDDNPIFSWTPTTYISQFTFEQSREMVRTLGQYMGLIFDPDVYHLLNTDLGGHPFLIRQVCSEINLLAVGKRPIQIDRTLYAKAKEIFNKKSPQYVAMIIDVLEKCYPDEYALLQYLAVGDDEAFHSFLTDVSASHLLGYEMIREGSHGYYFQIDIVREYLRRRHSRDRINLTAAERLSEVSERTVLVERKLRRLVRTQLQAAYGRVEATKKVLAAVPQERREKLGNWSYEDLFSDSKTPLFFLDLRNILQREWDTFRFVFDRPQGTVCQYLDDLNEARRGPAHAKDMTDEMFGRARLDLAYLEAALDEFLG